MMVLFARFTVFFLLVLGCSWSMAADDYPPVPHQELHDLIRVDPDQALQKIQQLYKQAEKQQDVGLQLEMLVLMAAAYESLEQLDKFNLVLAQGIELAKKLNEQGELAFFYSQKAYLLNGQGDREAALALIDQAIEMARGVGNNRLLANILLIKGQMFIEQGANEAALEVLLAAHDIYERHGDQESLSILYSHIGNVYSNLGQYGKAVRYHKKSAAMLPEGALREIGLVKLNIGVAYTMDGQHEHAEQFLGEARKIFNQEHIPDSLALVDFWLGVLNAQQENWSEAIAYYQSALEFYERTNVVSMQFNCRIRLAKINLEADDIAAARMQVVAARPLAEQLDTPVAKRTLTRIETRLAVAEKDFASAYRHSQETVKQLEKMHADDSNSKLERLQVQFETAQKEAENALLKERNKVQALTISSNRSQRNLAMVITGLVFLLLLGTFFAFLQQRRWHREMARLALEDELTGTANRRRILQLAEEAFALARRYPQSGFALVLMDLDHFKQVNDRYGHDVGDKVLRVFVGVSRSVIREQDALGRFGGEEWLLLLPNTTAREALEVVERIRVAFKASTVDGVPPEHVLSFSAGVTEFRKTDTSIDDLLQRADTAMYAAKQNGRDQSVLDPAVAQSWKDD